MHRDLLPEQKGQNNAMELSPFSCGSFVAVLDGSIRPTRCRWAVWRKSLFITIAEIGSSSGFGGRGISRDPVEA